MGRALRIVLIGLASVALAVVALIVLAFGALQLSVVRSAVRDELLSLINSALPGRLEVGELRLPRPNRVVVEDAVLRNPAGEVVAQVDRAQASIDLMALPSGTVRITSAKAEGARLQLGRLGKREGLLSALSAPTPDAVEPKPEAAGFPSAIELPDLKIVDSEVTAQLDAHRLRLEVAGLHGAVQAAIGGTTTLTLQSLRGAIHRDGRELARLAAPDGLPEHAKMAALALRGTLRLGETIGIDASARARALSSATLERAGLPGEWLSAPASLDVSARGDLEELRYRIELGYPGTPSPRSVAARVHGTLALDQTVEPASARIETTVEDARYEGTALPRAHAVVVLKDGGVQLESLRATQGGLELRAHGWGEPSGALSAEAKVVAGQLAELPIVQELAPELAVQAGIRASAHVERDADGKMSAHVNLTLRSLALEGFSADRIELEGSAYGTWSAPQLDASVHARDLTVEGREIARAELRVAGGPDTYRIRGSASEQRLAVRARIARRDGAWLANGRVRLRTEHGPLTAQVGRLRMRPGDAIAMSAVRVVFRGASAELSGKLGLGDQRSDLHMVGAVPSLAALAEPFTAIELRGRAGFDVRARGVLARPEIDASVIYRGGPRLEGAPLRADVDAELDVPRGRARIELTAAAGGDASAALALTSRFRAGALSLDALEHARHDLEARARNVPIAPLLARSPVAVPSPFDTLTGRATVRALLRGTIVDPLIGLELDGRMRFARDVAPLHAVIQQHYDDGYTVLSVKLDDRQGELLSAGFAGEARRDIFSRGPGHVLDVLRATRWDLALDLRSRRLWDLPAARALELTPQRYPIDLGLQAQITHRPHAEPTGHLSANARWHGTAQTQTAGCAALTDLRSQLTADMGGGTLRTQLEASMRGRHVLNLSTRSRAPIARWLDPGEMKLGPARLQAEIEALRVGRVPWLCDHARGVVSADVTAEDLFDPRASVSVRSQLEAFQLGQGPVADASVSARARGEVIEASLEASLAKRPGRASASAELPISFRVDRPSLCIHDREPLDVQATFEDMAVQPFLALVPAVAETSGQIDGTVALSGSLTRPSASGELELSDVSFTLPQLGQRFDGIDAAVELDGRTLRMPRARFEARDGYAVVSASATLSSAERWHAALDLRTDDFPLNNQGVYVGSVDAQASVTARTEPERIAVHAAIEDMSVQLVTRNLDGVMSLEPNPDIEFVHAEDTSAAPNEQEPGVQRDVVVTVETRSPVWITRDDFALEASADLTVRPSPQGARISGTIKVVRGKLSLLGQSFQVDRGTIQFTGADDPNPQLDLTARSEIPGGGTARVEVTGFVRSPELEFYVDGERVTAGEALASITGRRGTTDAAAEASAGEQLSSMALGMTMGLLSLGARRELGEWVPILSVEQGEESTRLTAGIEADRIIPKPLRGFVQGAYVEGIVSTGESTARGREALASANGASGGVLLELLLPRDLVWAAQYGPGERWSVDLDWRP